MIDASWIECVRESKCAGLGIQPCVTSHELVIPLPRQVARSGLNWNHPHRDCTSWQWGVLVGWFSHQPLLTRVTKWQKWFCWIMRNIFESKIEYILVQRMYHFSSSSVLALTWELVWRPLGQGCSCYFSKELLCCEVFFLQYQLDLHGGSGKRFSGIVDILLKHVSLLHVSLPEVKFQNFKSGYGQNHTVRLHSDWCTGASLTLRSQVSDYKQNWLGFRLDSLVWLIFEKEAWKSCLHRSLWFYACRPISVLHSAFFMMPVFMKGACRTVLLICSTLLS